METPSEIQRLTYDAVKEIVDIKRGSDQAPAFASLTEVNNFFHVEILEALRELYRRGLITHHTSINKIPMFGIKDDVND